MNQHSFTVSSDTVELARETGFSHEAVAAMRDAIDAGGGGMAQFAHPEFGGAGQWMRGGLLMTADPSDHALRTRIGALCERLSDRAERFGAPDERPTVPGRVAGEAAATLASSGPSPDPFAALERLADLHERGIVDAAEFAAKKAELLRRI